VAITIWTSIKAHEYYYPDDDFGQMVKEPTTIFIAKKNGRYEISYEEKVGNLRFNVVNVETGASVPVQELDFPATLAENVERRGHWFIVERPGTYRLSTDPWPGGTELYLDFKNTQAIALWFLGGIIIGAPFIGFGFLFLILRVASSFGSMEGQNVSKG
jgi:hypothetical protein